MRTKTKSLIRRTVSGLMAFAVIASNLAANVSAEEIDSIFGDNTAGIADVSPGGDKTEDDVGVNLIDTGDNVIQIDENGNIVQNGDGSEVDVSGDTGDDEVIDADYAEVTEDENVKVQSDDENVSDESGNESGEMTEEELLDFIDQVSDPEVVDENVPVFSEKDYIKANINPTYAKFNMFDLKDVLTVKQTLAVGSLLPRGHMTIDDMWELNGGAYDSALVSQILTGVGLYDTDASSDYYVGYADTMISDESMYVSDFVFAYNNNNGEVINDCVYDENTGLVYVPKSYLLEDKLGYGCGNVQVQFLQIVESYSSSGEVNVIIHNDGVAGDIAESGVVTVDDITSGFVTVQLAKNVTALESIDANHINVIVNGVLLTSDNQYVYDNESGALTVFYSPASINTFEITVLKDSILNNTLSWINNNIFGNIDVSAANASISNSTDSFKEYYAAAWKFKIAPKEGDKFTIDGAAASNGTGTWNGDSAVLSFSDTSTWSNLHYYGQASGNGYTLIQGIADKLSATAKVSLVDKVQGSAQFLALIPDGANVAKGEGAFANATVPTGKIDYRVYKMACCHLSTAQNPAGSGSPTAAYDSSVKLSGRVLKISYTDKVNQTKGRMLIGLFTNDYWAGNTGNQQGYGAYWLNWEVTEPAKATVKFNIVKRSSTNSSAYLDGGQFSVVVTSKNSKYASNPLKYEVATTDTATGSQLKFTAVKDFFPATVVVTEISAPNGYKKNGTSFSFEISDNNSIKEVSKNIPGYKLDANGKKLTVDNDVINDLNPIFLIRKHLSVSDKGKTAEGLREEIRRKSCRIVGNDNYGFDDSEEDPTFRMYVLNSTTGQPFMGIYFVPNETVELNNSAWFKFDFRNFRQVHSDGSTSSFDHVSNLLNKVGDCQYFAIVETNPPKGCVTMNSREVAHEFGFDEDEFVNGFYNVDGDIRIVLKVTARHQNIGEHANDSAYINKFEFEYVADPRTVGNSDYEGSNAIAYGKNPLVGLYKQNGYLDDSDMTNLIYLYNEPAFDPEYGLLVKSDADSPDGKASGNAKLEGARYGVWFYDDMNKTTLDDDWLFKMEFNTKTVEYKKSNGETFEKTLIALGKDFLVDGSFVHASNEDRDADKQITFEDFFDPRDNIYSSFQFPLGTIIIQELDPPEGYTLDDTLYIHRVVPDVVISQDNRGKEIREPQGVKMVSVDENGKEIDFKPIVIEQRLAGSDEYSWITHDLTVLAEIGEKRLYGGLLLTKVGDYSNRQGKAILWADYIVTNESENPVDLDPDAGYPRMATADLEKANMGTIPGNVVVASDRVAPGGVVAKIRCEEKTNGGETLMEHVLPYGDYKVIEYATSDDYYLRDFEYDFTIDSEDCIVFAPKNVNDVKRAQVSVQKFNARTEKTDVQGDASLEGAEFTFWNKSDNPVWIDGKKIEVNGVVCTISTDSDGLAVMDDKTWLPIGTYEVKETAAPEGFKLNTEWAQTVEVTADNAGEVIKLDECTMEHTPHQGCPEEEITFDISIRKVDKLTGSTVPVGNAVLWAEYDIINNSKNPVTIGDKTYGVGEVVAHGRADKSNGYTFAVKGLPYGTYSAKETSCSPDYEIDADFNATFVGRVDGEVLSAVNENTPKQAKIAVQKFDKDTGLALPQGDASLEGAEFTFWNKSENPVIVNGKTIDVDGEICTIRTDATGHAVMDADIWLPIGTYEVKETGEPPVGYKKNEAWSQTVEVKAGDANTTIELNDLILEHTEHQGCPEETPKGNVNIRKIDKLTDSTTPVGDAVLWAEYDIINNSANAVSYNGKLCGVGEVVTHGRADTSNNYSFKAEGLPYGTYTVVETACSSDYDMDPDFKKTFTIRTDGEWAEFENANTPKTGGVLAEKFDYQIIKVQGDATFAGTEFTIYNECVSKNDVIVNGKTVKYGEAVMTITADANGIAQTAANVLPIGSYRIKETKAPTGYHINNDWSKVFKVTALNAGTVQKYDVLTVEEVNDASSVYGVPDKIFRGGVRIEKWDKEFNAPEALEVEKGLEGIQFELKNVSKHDVQVEGNVYKSGETIKLSEPITVHWNESEKTYMAQTANDLLPYGTYEIKEIAQEGTTDKANAYYMLTDGASKTFEIRQDKVIVKVDVDGNELVFKNTPVRNDFTFIKVKEDPNAVGEIDPELMERLHTLWVIENTKTGERHVFKTNEDGVFDSSATKEIGHSTNMNGLDKYLDQIDALSDPKAENPIEMSDVDDVGDTGLWFGLGEFGTEAPVNDKLGALPYGTYLITEVRTDTNRGLNLQQFSIVINRDKSEGGLVDQGYVVDRSIKIETTGVDEQTEDHVGLAREDVVIIDTVDYKNLVVGKNYTLKGTLINKDTGEVIHDAQGNEVTAETTFKAETKDGAVTVTFRFDGSLIKGTRTVVFEDLYEEKMYAVSHADVEDEDQSISYPEIKTVATANKTKDHDAKAEPDVTITDKISYSNLLPDKEYTIKGILMDLTTKDEVIDAKGKEVTASKTFTPNAKDGEVEMQFNFDASNLAGHTVVVFEYLEFEGVRVAIHADLTDVGQTIYFPKIGTKAEDADTRTIAGAAYDTTTFIDTVSYSNVIVGKEYTMNGTLMIKDTNKPLLDKNGNEIKSSITFIPTETSGTVELAFTFDSSLVEGKTIVAFEDMERVNLSLATHADINDEGQTVFYPEIGTTALYGKFHEGLAAKDAVINDTVEYKNLVPGYKYILTGTLMDQSTGTAVLNDGKEIQATTEFTPKEANGKAVVTFKFDASEYAGETFVVFEKLAVQTKVDGKDVTTNVARHEEITDEGQTIHFPEIGTTLTDSVTKDHDAMANGKIKLVDTVEYHNLTVGKEYTMNGTLMNQADGKPMLDDNGKEIKGSTKFTSEKTDGVVEVVFEFSGLKLIGQTVVAFEDLKREDVTVAIHTEIEDEPQTVWFPRISTTAIDEATGDDEGVVSEKSVIIDTVKYENLLVGRQYRLDGVLMDKETGKEFLDKDGNKVTSTVTFVAAEANGSIDMRFEFDTISAAGKDIVVFEDLYRDEFHVATHTDITDEGQTVHYPSIKTTALCGDTNDHEGLAKEDAVIIDTVEYKNLRVGKEYVISGVLMDKDTGEAVVDKDGNQITSSVKFTPEKADGTVDVEFRFDATDFADHTFVVFEDLYRKDVRIITHADIEDLDQTVHYPKIETELLDGVSGSHEAMSQETVTLIDTVTYNNLTPGREYTLKGTLMNQETGEPMVNGDGSEVANEIKFTPNEPDGVVEIEFTFHNVNLEGLSVVAFEYVEYNNIPVAVHTEITDESQTVNFPKMRTILHKYSAMVSDDKAEINTDATNATEAMDVTVSSTEAASETLKARAAETTAVSGTTVSGTNTTNVSGTVTNGTTKANEKNEEFLKEYELKTDENGFVKEVFLNNEIKLTDEIILENLTVDNTYTVKGVLMNKDTKESVKDADGKDITSEITFKATEEDMTVQLEFQFDGTVTDARTVVAFDELYAHVYGDKAADNNDTQEKTEAETQAATDAVALADNDVPVQDETEATTEASAETTANAGVTAGPMTAADGATLYLMAEGKDLEDENETIKVINPDAKTEALGEKTGSHMLDLAEQVTIVDTVFYRNLNPGTEYRVQGTLMNKDTGKEMLDKDKKPIVSEVVFTPEKSTGTVEVKFVVDTTLLIGQTIVVFEDVYIKDIKVIAHADIEDEEQTTYVMKVGTTATGSDGRSKTVDISKKVTIKDTVAFENLAIGEEYLVRGAIMNRKTGKQVGSAITVKFKPDKVKGAIDVNFEVDTSELAGETLVCFEEVTDAKGNLLGKHCDINDDQQAVVVKTKTKIQTGVQTYSDIAAKIAIGAVVVLMMAVAGIVVYKKRRLNKIRKDNY